MQWITIRTERTCAVRVRVLAAMRARERSQAPLANAQPCRPAPQVPAAAPLTLAISHLGRAQARWSWTSAPYLWLARPPARPSPTTPAPALASPRRPPPPPSPPPRPPLPPPPSKSPSTSSQPPLVELRSAPQPPASRVPTRLRSSSRSRAVNSVKRATCSSNREISTRSSRMWCASSSRLSRRLHSKLPQSPPATPLCVMPRYHFII